MVALSSLSPSSREIQHFITPRGVEEKPWRKNGSPTRAGRGKRPSTLTEVRVRPSRPLAVKRALPGPQLERSLPANCACQLSCLLLSSWLHIREPNSFLLRSVDVRVGA